MVSKQLDNSGTGGRKDFTTVKLGVAKLLTPGYLMVAKRLYYSGP